MTIKTAMLTLAAVGTTPVAAPAAAVDFHGYARSGVMGNSGGGGPMCFGSGTPLTADGYKFRLGNECETYAEAEFAQTLYKDKSGVEVMYDTMLAYQTQGMQSYESLKSDGGSGDIALRQLWVGAKNLPFLPSATFWIGNRYYKRHDVHMADFFYWDPSGEGAGVEDIDLGVGKLSLAVFQSVNSGTRTGWRSDVRVAGIPLWTDGSLEVGVNVNFDTRTDAATATTGKSQAVSPWVTAEWKQVNLLGGYNTLAFQYATGTAAPMGARIQGGNSSKSKQWRVVEHLIVQPSDKFSASFFAHYADVDRRYNATDAYSSFKQIGVGIRPIYHLSDYFKLQGEVGFQSADFKDAAIKDMSVTKITVAPTLTIPPGPGGIYYTRPELRLFATYATWDKGAQAQGIAGQSAACTTGGTSTSPFQCETNCMTVGAQLEAWW